MSKFKFIVDEKYTVWERCHVEVEAESLEEAIEMCKDGEYDVEDSEIMYDTMIPLSIIEIFDDDYNSIYSNNYDL